MLMGQLLFSVPLSRVGAKGKLELRENPKLWYQLQLQ